MVSIAARVSSVSPAMATTWLCHHNSYKMARLAVAGMMYSSWESCLPPSSHTTCYDRSKHSSYSLSDLQTLASTSPSHRQAFGRAGLIEELAKLDIDNLQPAQKGIHPLIAAE